MRGLRTIPVVLGIVRDMEELCPDALVPQLHEPDGACSSGPSTRRIEFPTVGLCHSVFWTVHALAGYLGVPRRGGRRTSRRASTTWPSCCARAPRPRPLPGPARRSSRRAGSPTTTSSAPSCTGGSATTRPSRRSTTPSTTRGSSPRARSSGSTSRSASTSTRVANNLDEYEDTKRQLDAGEPFEIERSGEYAAVIVNAIATGEPARIVGQRDERRRALIPNLAGDACVEVPALVDGLGRPPDRDRRRCRPSAPRTSRPPSTARR